MLEFDHIALTVTNLEGSINFYKVLGYKVETVFEEEDYRWASLLLGDTSLELFQIKNKKWPKIYHVAYNFTDEKEAISIAKSLGYEKEDLDIFFGDLNRESFFLEDKDNISIQLIRKK